MILNFEEGAKFEMFVELEWKDKSFLDLHSSHWIQTSNFTLHSLIILHLHLHFHLYLRNLDFHRRNLQFTFTELINITCEFRQSQPRFNQFCWRSQFDLIRLTQFCKQTQFNSGKFSFLRWWQSQFEYCLKLLNIKSYIL